jgi:hypothetical protein
MDPDQSSVRLRNGDELPQPVVMVIFMTLKQLLEEHPIAFYEMVMIARNPSHKPFWNTGAHLARLGILEDGGAMHDATRSVVLASTEGELHEVRLVYPIEVTCRV